MHMKRIVVNGAVWCQCLQPPAATPVVLVFLPASLHGNIYPLPRHDPDGVHILKHTHTRSIQKVGTAQLQPSYSPVTTQLPPSYPVTQLQPSYNPVTAQLQPSYHPATTHHGLAALVAAQLARDEVGAVGGEVERDSTTTTDNVLPDARSLLATEASHTRDHTGEDVALIVESAAKGVEAAVPASTYHRERPRRVIENASQESCT